MAIATPLLIVTFGIASALSGQLTASTTPSLAEDKAVIEMSSDWLCPTKLGGPLVDAGEECKFPVVSASSVKDMISAQMSCGSCS